MAAALIMAAVDIMVALYIMAEVFQAVHVVECAIPYYIVLAISVLPNTLFMAGKQYVCEFYTGTFYQDFLLTANIHSFGSMERFVSCDYEFMHSTFIVIEIPEYFTSGYYFINGVGLFRYVDDEDKEIYNGEAYDAAIDWNEPLLFITMQER